jgi:hypothetical protein
VVFSEIANTSDFRTPALRFFELSFRSDPRRALCVSCGTHRTNLYPAGFNPGPQSLMRIARARAPRRDGTFLFCGIFQPLLGHGHTSTLDLIIFSYRSSFLTL